MGKLFSRHTKWLTIGLGILCVVLVCVVIALSVKLNKKNEENHEKSSVVYGGKICKSDSQTGTINLQEPDQPSVFHDLTKKEIQGLMQFLYADSSLNLTKPSDVTVMSSYKYLAELYLPNKSKVLDFLDNNQLQPPREAKVTIFRGDKLNPVVNEYVVGPLPNPTYMQPIPGNPSSVPFTYRPVNIPEIDLLVETVTNTIAASLSDFLMDMYGGKLKNCADRCLQFSYFNQVTSAVTDEQKRVYWMWLSRSIEYYLLNPLDFAVLMNTDNVPFTIELIWFNGTNYDGIQSLRNNYTNNMFNGLHYQDLWPTDNVKFSEAKRRGTAFTEKPLPGPILVEPEGKRYSIQHRHVTYMPWTFDFRMSSAYGPQLYDIRYKGERIVYELGLQELCVFYSGYSIFQKLTDFFDSTDLIGPKASTLVPGIDCPKYATFISATHSIETSDEPEVFPNAWCLFEVNTGDPLRRHLTHWPYKEAFYEGAEKVVLTLRTVLTIINYDYIIDFRFFLTGAIEVKLTSTGFISTTFYSPEEDPYGYRLHDTITGNIHQHLTNFKVDLDVKGTSNRFETLDIEQDVQDNPLSKNLNAKYYQTKFSRNLKQTEMDAAYKFNFSAPKYLTILNEALKNKYGTPAAYRLLLKGMTKFTLEEGENNEPAASWARYQMAITKRKEEERFSSSQYAGFDANAPNPVVQFQNFLKDNDNIVDEDLVAWVSLGMNHIPHQEDLPVTPTPGMDVSFYLLPYNYFPVDPAIASYDHVRINPQNINDKSQGIAIKRNLKHDELSCSVPESKFWAQIKEDQTILFNTS